MLQRFAPLDDATHWDQAFKTVPCLEQYTLYPTIEGSGKLILNATGRATNKSSVWVLALLGHPAREPIVFDV